MDRNKADMQDLRVLPALVMNLVLHGAFLVGWVRQPDLQNLRIVQDLMMEAEDLLVLAVHGRRHVDPLN